MIPVIVGGLAIAAFTLEIMSGAAAAGAGYGAGRKYGRKICEAVDNIDLSVKKMFNKE
jgi:hypothetical protein